MVAGCSMACAAVPAQRRQSRCPESGYAHRRALEKLAHLEISYPMMFEVTNPRYLQRRLHCGVLEFIAQEGHTHCHAHCHAHCRTRCILAHSAHLAYLGSRASRAGSMIYTPPLTNPNLTLTLSRRA